MSEGVLDTVPLVCPGHYGTVVGSRACGRSRDARPGVSSLLPVTCLLPAPVYTLLPSTLIDIQAPASPPVRLTSGSCSAAGLQAGPAEHRVLRCAPRRAAASRAQGLASTSDAQRTESGGGGAPVSPWRARLHTHKPYLPRSKSRTVGKPRCRMLSGSLRG